MTSHPLLTTIIRELEQHQDAQRIKKLLIYAAENHWESNPQMLQRFPLEQIVQKLITQFTDEGQLQQALEVAVGTLSRPATYSWVASEILAHLGPLYEESEGETKIVMATPAPQKGQVVTNILLEATAHNLETHREGIRIKKLLYALCYERWENNFQVLGQISFVELLQQLVQYCVTYSHFKTALQQLVASLNRQTAYTQIAEFMLSAIAPLYSATDPITGVTRPTLPPPPQKPSTYPAPDYKQTLDNDEEEKTEVSLASGNYKGTIAINIPPLGLSPTPPATPAPPRHFAEELNSHELKLEVMKYANPLRAKILLFSAVHHPFDLSGQDWSMLRTCDFDDLLRKVIKSAPSVVELEIKLSAIAQALFEPDEHLHATSAIIQAINLLLNTPKLPSP